MSLLKIYKGNDIQIFNEKKDIIKTLASYGIIFEEWKADAAMSEKADQEEVLKAYDTSVKKLMKDRGFLAADVVSIQPQTQNHKEFRKKYIEEHTHDDDEARFFVDGSGLFYINAGELVFGLLCEKGDLINVPAGTKHWFDMGPSPFFKCIRVFKTPEGWVGKFTGSGISKNYPLFENFKN